MSHEPGAPHDPDAGARPSAAPSSRRERAGRGSDGAEPSRGEAVSGRVDRLCGILGLAATSLLALGLTPVWSFPAWPAVTVGSLALLCALPQGRPGWRGVGAFLGLLGVVGGALQIAGLWYVVLQLGG